MKKYTTPEVEVIKFQIQEAIADTDSGMLSMQGGAGQGNIPGRN